ncbi:MAG: mutL [Chlamydiales bacterium]|jgi:DNA mismatch repair protein MutL|nr:mutL [Chlamydiales bacterium]
MASVIHVLSEQAINQIAAGEVIENPGSIVKELVENALDAGASEITIEVKAGGRQLIRITDNGCGMSFEDAVLCLQRHATSKISSLDDLNILATMGFRGEAIPSIASVSKFTILTAQETSSEDTTGTLVCVDGGKLVQHTKATRPRGTTIEVKSLFFNVPVRKKFQKSINFDNAEIQKIITLLALGNPGVKFHLINEDKSLLKVSFQTNTTPDKLLSTRVLDVMGIDFFKELRPFDIRDGKYRFHGYIGHPHFVKHNRTGQYLFINRRPVLVPLISSALKAGYGTRLPTQKYPVCILYLEIPSDQVDVNVHPQKREVRLREESFVYQMVIRGVEKALRANLGVSNTYSIDRSHCDPQHQTPADISKNGENLQEFSDFNFIEKEERAQQFSYVNTHINPFENKEILTARKLHISSTLSPTSPTAKLPISVPDFSNKLLDRDDKESLGPQTIANVLKSSPQELTQQELFHTDKEQILFKPHIIGILPTLILIEAKSIYPLPPYCTAEIEHEQGGMLLLDTAAARSRILFEQFLQTWQHQSDLENNRLHTQSLLLPLTIELSQTESILLEQYLDDLGKMGIILRPFGERTFLVEALPTSIRSQDMQAIIADTLEALNLGVHTPNKKILQREKQVAIAISRAASQQPKLLQQGEATTLILQLLKTNSPYESPFGKPTFAYLSLGELEKKFKKSS